MAAVIGSERTGIEATGKTVDVASSPKARLMYYFNCVVELIGEDGLDADVLRLTRYQRYYSLSNNELRALVSICSSAVPPSKLEGQVFFESERACGSSDNEFYSISQASTFMVVSAEVMVGGQRRRVAKIMTYKRRWIQRNYWEPLRELQRLISSQQRGGSARSSSSSSSSSNSSCSIQ